MNLHSIRPSSVLAAAEDGVLATGQLLGRCALALGHSARAKGRQVRNEYKARKLAEANVLADDINQHEEEADREEIARRCEELIGKRRAAAKKSQRKAR